MRVPRILRPSACCCLSVLPLSINSRLRFVRDYRVSQAFILSGGTLADLCSTTFSWHPGSIPATESRLKRNMVHWTATRSRHAAQGCRALASAPLGIVIQSTTSCSRTATRSRHGRCGGSGTCGDGTSLRFMLGRTAGRLGTQESTRQGSALLGCMTKARWALRTTRGEWNLRQVWMILPLSACVHFERGLLLKVCNARQYNDEFARGTGYMLPTPPAGVFLPQPTVLWQA